MRRLAPLSVLLTLFAGCVYDYPIEEKTQCDPTGACGPDSKCLGGICVNKSRARCTPGDRRCIDGRAWVCTDGNSEVPDDCAAKGLTCGGGYCRKDCSACGPYEQCDKGTNTCVPSTNCGGSDVCPDGQVCVDFPGVPARGVCVPEPAPVLNPNLSCYPVAPGGQAKTFAAVAKAPSEIARPGVVGTVVSPSGGGAFTANASDGTFSLTLPAPWSPLVLDVPGGQNAAGVVLLPSRQYGPTLTGADTERVDLVTFTDSELQALVAIEAPPAGPGWDPKGRGILLGRVRDCAGAPLAGATVGYSTGAGRAGYLTATRVVRGTDSATAENSGGFVAFDLPTDVDIGVVVLMNAVDNSGTRKLVTVSAQTVRIGTPGANASYGVASVAAGRGGRTK